MAAHAALATRSEYLSAEASASERHEFVDGHVYSMAGASRNHVEITAALSGELRNALRGSECRNLDQDTKVWVEKANSYFYPDASISCPPNFVDSENGVIDNPRVICEVLSPATASLDEGAKFAAYRQLETLRDYLLIDSRSRSVKVYSLEEEVWNVREFGHGDDSAPIPSVGVMLNLKEIYRFAEFSK